MTASGAEPPVAAAPPPEAPDLAAVQTALLVRAHRSFRRAAEVLGVSASIVSRRVGTLERALGRRLFERSASGVRPTAAGQRYLDGCEPALALLQRACAGAMAAGRGQTGRLGLGHVWPLAAGPAGRSLAAFRAGAPQVELDLREARARDLSMAVLDGQLDAALIAMEDAPPGLMRLPLGSEPWLLAWPGAGGPGPDRAPVICSALDDPRRIARLAASALGGGPAEVRPQRTGHRGVLALVAAGAGVAVVPEGVARACPAEAGFTQISDSAGGLRLCLAWRDDRGNPALDRFLALLRTAGAAPAGADRAA